MSIAFLSLGTNLGDKKENLRKAILLIENEIGNISAQSSIIENEPWGFKSPNSFLNMVIKIETPLSPIELLKASQKIEKQIGRANKTQNTYQDRIIDIDIILFDDLVINTPELTIPHPRYKERDFVMIPLKEII